MNWQKKRRRESNTYISLQIIRRHKETGLHFVVVYIYISIRRGCSIHTMYNDDDDDDDD